MRLKLICILLLAGAALSEAAESYMNLVGQLYAGVQTPRFALQVCKTTQPKLSAAIEEQYEAWRKRNAEFLDRAQAQFVRADARLKRQGHSLAEADAALLQQLNSMDTQQLCSSFSQLLSLKDRQFGAELGQLLETVAQADEVLVKREQQK